MAKGIGADLGLIPGGSDQQSVATNRHVAKGEGGAEFIAIGAGKNPHLGGVLIDQGQIDPFGGRGYRFEVGATDHHHLAAVAVSIAGGAGEDQLVVAVVIEVGPKHGTADLLAVATHNHQALELGTVELPFWGAHKALEPLQFCNSGRIGDVVAEYPHHPALVVDAGNAIEAWIGYGYEGTLVGAQAAGGDGFGKLLVGRIGEGVLVGEGQAGVEAGVDIQ